MTAQLYARAGGLAKRMAVIAAVVVVGGVGVVGCATTPDEPLPDGIARMEPPEMLYRAIVRTYERQKLPVKLASPKFKLVTSEYQAVGRRLRRRLATRVIRAAPGAMGLKVVAEWQRRVKIDGAWRWQEVDTPELRNRGNTAEVELGRAIEQRFEDWKERGKTVE